MDNERPIEKLLRRYAKKRRDEAGAPVEMYPATRRILQGEVARQFRKEHGKQVASSGSSVRWWPRLVYGLCALTVLALVAVTFLPDLSRSKSRSLEMAGTSSSRIDDFGGRQFAEEKDNQPIEPFELARNGAPALSLDERGKLAKGTDDFDVTLAESTTLAYADATRSDSSASLVTREESVLPGTPAPSRTIAPVPATASPVRFGEESTNWPGIAGGYGTTTGQTFALARTPVAEDSRNKMVTGLRNDQKAQTQMTARFSNTDEAGSKAAVLVSFQVEQAGDELRVIDSDGSTYAGKIVAVVDQAAAEENLLKKTETKAPASQSAASRVFDTVSSRDASAQNAFFRVSGTNRTLKQQVVFTGNFVAVTNTVQPQSLGMNGSKQAQNLPVQQMFQMQLNNSIIVGRAQLERDNDIEVNAVPVSR